MTRPRVLVIGVDPRRYADRWDPTPIMEALARGDERFAEYGIAHHTALIHPHDDDAERRIVELLASEPWACVVIGGGVRGPDLLEYFELVVNRVRQHAPQAAIAFNATPDDCADAARRWLPTD